MADLGPTLTDRDTDVLGDAFGEVAEMAHWVAGRMSPVLDHATVGSDISSATHGSSVASVAGKNRAPTKQWAEASERGSKTNKRTNTKVRRHPGRQNMTILHIWI